MTTISNGMVTATSGLTRLNQLVRDSIKKLNTTDFERIRSEIALTHKEPVSRRDIKAAIQAAGPVIGGRTAPMKMSDEEKFELTTWIKERKGVIEEAKMSAAMLLAEFSKAHPEIYVVEENVRSAAKVAKVELFRRPVNPVGRPPGEGTIARLEARIKALEDTVATLITKLGGL